MVNRARLLLILTGIALVGSQSQSAFAQQMADSPPMLDAAYAPSQPQYGGAFRFRYVSVPSWFLDLFAKENTPLSSYHTGFEFQRRKEDLDIVVGLSYQNMSPTDGNWLGRGKSPAIDVDYVQFKGLALWSLDVSFIWNHFFNDYIGFRYGAGLGLGIVAGKILRTSAGPCTDENAGDETQCKPQLNCPAGQPCPESILKNSETGPDTGVNNPHRFREDDVPGALPILNLVMGPALRIPEVPGLEARLEAGWFNAFFAGISISYLR